MTRLGMLGLALALALAATPSLADAQRGGAAGNNRFLRDATTAMGRAMIATDETARRPLFEQVLQHTAAGLEVEPNNAQLWLFRGQAAAGLNRFEMAHEALEKALQLNPEYAEEIESDREAAWISAFNMGIDLMNEQKFEEAVAMLEMATKLYDKRPEALMNLGSLYAHLDRYDDADRTFLRAVAAIDGPLTEKLDEEGRASWARLRNLATINRAEILGARGVAAYQDRDFKEALRLFGEASKVNPQSRDYLYNVAQASHARATQLTDERDEAPDRAAAINAELETLYNEIIAIAPRVMEFDPNNELTWLLVARAQRGRADLLPEAERAPLQQKTLEALQKQQELKFVLDEIYIRPEAGKQVLTGHFKNVSLEAGAAARVQFMVLGMDGRTLTEETVTLEAPEAGEILEFRLELEVNSEVAGWKYRPVS
jgi:tetratricopeptide (TPR) repeat protein